MTLEELKKNHPALVEALKTSVLTESAVETEKAKALVAELEIKLKASNETVVARETENKALAEKLKAGELTAAAKDTAVQALSERLAALEADNVRKGLRQQVLAAVSQAMTGQPVGALICKHVEQEFDANRYSKVEEAVEAAQAKLAFAKAAMAVSPNAGAAPAGTPPSPTNEGTATGTPPAPPREVSDTVAALMN